MKDSRRLWVERGKNALIAVLLLCAVYLSFHTLVYSMNPDRDDLWSSLDSLFRPDGETASGTDGFSLTELIRPVRIAVNTPDGRYGVEYDSAAVDAVYDETAGLLAECLLRAEAPAQATAAGWNRALESTGIYYDFLGDIPLSALSAWLGQGTGNGELTRSARRLLLADDGQGGVNLWFWDSETDRPWRCATSSVLQGQLEQILEGYLPNNATFAFQSGGQYGKLDSNQLLAEQAPVLPVYAAANPMAADDSLGEALLRTVGINPHALYTSPDGAQVARDGSCTIRIAPNGLVQFSAGQEDSSARLPISAEGDEANETEAVEGAWRLLERTMAPTMGDARLYLISCLPVDGGWEVRFGYLLSGAQVELAEEGHAARVIIQGRRISQFDLSYRAYSATEDTSALLGSVRAVAALMAMDGEGRELLAAYLDAGETRLQASWIAD